MESLTSRRHFLRSSGALLFGAASLSSKLAIAQSNLAGNNLSGVDYWDMVREQFSFANSAVPMNAANLCPSFRAVAENVAHLTADIDRDCSFQNRAKFEKLLEDARTQVAAQLNVSPDEVALVRNTSEANNIVNNGLQLDAGDEVLIWDENHPTNNIAWDVRSARCGTTVTKVHTPTAPSTEQLIDAFTSRFNARTKVLALSHVSNISGTRLPIAQLVGAAQARGIYVHVDGAQTWGAMDLDLRALGVDSFTASAHKWYMGPKEVGLLYVKKGNINRIWPNVVAAGWGTRAETSVAGARKFESLGQRNDAALAALGVAARIHNTIGARRIEERTVYLAQYLKTSVREIGLPLVTPMDPALSFGVCIVQIPKGHAGKLSNRLYTEFGIAGADTGGLRLCPAIYNTVEHVNRAVAGLKALMT